MTLRSLLVACAATAIVLALAAGPPAVRAEEPEITYQWPENGAVIEEPPLALQMCFREPVNVKDLPPLDVGDFAFTLTRPDNLPLGMRIIFQPDGYGVVIQPGTTQPDPPEGEWTWTYRLVDAASGDALEGTTTFTVNAADGEPIIPANPPPPMCLAEGATQQPTPDGTGETADASETPGGDNVDDDDDGDGSTLLGIVLIALGIFAVTALVGVAAYFIRQRMTGGTPPAGPGAPP